MRIVYVGSPELLQDVSKTLLETEEHPEVFRANTGRELSRALEHPIPGAILFDTFSGTIPLSHILQQAAAQKVPVIAVASLTDDDPVPDERLSGCVFRERLGCLKPALQTIFEKCRLERERRVLQRQLSESDRFYQTLLGHINDFLVLMDEAGKVTYQSPSTAQRSGFPDLCGRQVYDCIFPDDRPPFVRLFQQAGRKPGTAAKGQFRFRHAEGHYFWIEASITNLAAHRAIDAYAFCCTDITERKKAELELIQMNRLYVVISHINQMIVAVEDEQTLFRQACDIAIQHGSFKLAYIGMPDDQEAFWLVHGSGLGPEHEAGPEPVPGFMHSPLADVLRTGSYYVCNNIQRDFALDDWKPMARARGFASCIALPVKKLDKIVAIFILAAAEPDFFSEKEIALLEEATGDISFKLDVLEREKHRLEAEARLRHSELRLKQAQAIAHLGSWEVDFQTGKAIWSEESLRIYGLPPDEYEQSYEVWVSFIHPEDMDYVMRVSNEAVRTKAPGILYHRILRKDGTVRYLHSESHFLFDEAGNPTGLYGIAHDITDLKATEEALRESELRYSTIFHFSPQPKWIYDPESFRFVQVNRAAVERYGYSEEEFCNMTIFDIRPKEDYERVIKHMNKDVRALAGSRDSQFRHYTKSGEEIEVEIHSSSLVLNAKPYKLVVAIDVTAINRHQDRITSAIIQAQENERYEIGSELHDNVCQVLATSRLNLFALQPSIPAGILAPYKQASDHIAQAIREVRNLSHRLAPASFSDSTLEEAVKLLISSYSSFSGLHIELHVSPAIHDYDMSHGMKLNLYRIIQEQLNNIVKHAAAARACIELALISDHLLLLITDNGQGFDPSAVKGGIGMANMKRRAELFRGTLKIVSAPGQGTKLTLSIPGHNGPYRPAPATATPGKR